MWPPPDELLAAWRLLVADPDTAGAFAEMALPPLRDDLARRFPNCDPDLVTEAADFALLAFLRKADAFDPGRLPLASYLLMIAQRDLFNALAKEKRHHRGRIPWERVELTLPAGNEEEEAEALADDPRFREAVASLPDGDRRVFELLLGGERDGDAFAAALDLGGLPADERRAEVKRAKDRVKARLKRAGGAG